MNLHFIRTVGLLFFLILHFCANCQESIDGEFIFKTQLFLEKACIVNTSGFKYKDNSLLTFFTENTRLNLDTLSSFGFPSEFIFLSLSPNNAHGENAGITYSNNITKTDSAIFLFIGSNCKNYVLCLDKYSGKSFRLKGFEGNDFYNLFAEVNKRLEILRKRKVSMKAFVEKIGVSSVDFECLYKALKSCEYNKEKYPCLRGCEAENITIH